MKNARKKRNRLEKKQIWRKAETTSKKDEQNKVKEANEHAEAEANKIQKSIFNLQRNKKSYVQ